MENYYLQRDSLTIFCLDRKIKIAQAKPFLEKYNPLHEQETCEASLEKSKKSLKSYFSLSNKFKEENNNLKSTILTMEDTIKKLTSSNEEKDAKIKILEESVKKYEYEKSLPVPSAPPAYTKLCMEDSWLGKKVYPC